MGSSLSTFRAKPAETMLSWVNGPAPSETTTSYDSELEVSDSTSKDSSVTDLHEASKKKKAGPRQQPDPGLGLSPTAAMLKKLSEPLVHGEPIDLDAIVKHLRPDLGATAPPPLLDQDPGPAGPCLPWPGACTWLCHGCHAGLTADQNRANSRSPSATNPAGQPLRPYPHLSAWWD